jgi:Zn finger protein HypA/HybF involved in hydrogenase expression
MTGRFKNKNTVVKSIGKDEHGMPTINGRKVVTFRMVKEGFISELAGTAVKCEKCNHSWDIESEDTEKYLCHSCGWDSQKQEYDFDAFDSWREKMGLTEGANCTKPLPNETQDQYRTRCFGYNPLTPPPSGMVREEELEERSKGKLRPADLLRRKAAMAGKRAQIARRRARTMKRRKPLAKLKKIAYKKAYLQVYDEFREELFPGISKKDLSIQQAKIVHKNVVRKKGRVLKRAKFRFLPALRDAEAQKFAQKNEIAPHGYPDQEWMDNHDKELKKLRTTMDTQHKEFYKEHINESKLLQEGGAYGHMSHPFDTDINLTFGQLKDIVNRALEGTLEFTREKTDGQALAISWRDGRLVAARNKGHLKNRGENALDIKGVSDKFQGRGGLSDAYNYAMKDLSNAIKSLNDKQRDKIFKQGACFMNLEVIYPTSVNVIPYGQALLVFHGTMEFNMEGVAIGENGESARVLAGMIKQVNKDVQDNYTIQGPPIVKLPKSQDLSKKRSKYSSQISKLQKEFSLKDTDGVANYHQSWWEQWVDKNSPSSLDNKTKMGLVKRWAFMDKGFRLDKKNITDEKTLEWAKKTDKDDQKKIGKKNLMKFEQIFLGLGAEVLEFTSSALTVNADSAVRDMKKRIDKTIKDVKKSGDPKKIEKLKLELGRLKSIGGSKKIVPNEGIVFLYKGNTFKLTGTFASVNQILGIFF